MAKIVPATGDLNFTRLAELLEAEAGLEPGQGEAVAHAMLDIIGRHVAAGFRVRLTNFGSFSRITRRIASSGLPHKRETGSKIPTVVSLARFRATGVLADAVRNETPVITLRKRAKGAVSGS